MYIVNWHNRDHKFFSRRAAEEFLYAVIRRGYCVKYKWNSMAGNTYWKVN